MIQGTYTAFVANWFEKYYQRDQMIVRFKKS